MNSLKNIVHSMDKIVRVGVNGITSKSRIALSQFAGSPEIRVVAISHTNLLSTVDVAQLLKMKCRVVENAEEFQECVEADYTALFRNATEMILSGGIDVLLEASEQAMESTSYAMEAFQNKINVVMLNPEAELLYGPLLFQYSKEAGVNYSFAGSGRCTAALELIAEMDKQGLSPVMTGFTKEKIIDVNTGEVINNVDCRNDAHLCIDLAILTNTLNGRAIHHEIEDLSLYSSNEIFNVHNFGELWKDEITNVAAVVFGGHEPGVFAIGCPSSTTNNDRVRPDVSNVREMRNSPFQIYYRPCNVNRLEAMEPCSKGKTIFPNTYGMHTNVFTYAQRDLKKGEILDGLHGIECYGRFENIIDHRDSPGLPIGLSENVRLRGNVARNTRIALSDIEYHANDAAFRLYFDACEVNPENINGRRYISKDYSKTKHYLEPS
jgi:predicted homoserine dehydrogenase-like protein